MKKTGILSALLFVSAGISQIGAQSESIPLEWIDPQTQHKVVRLTRTGDNNQSFYFHNNPFLRTTDGKDDLMLYTGMVDGNWQFFSLNMRTLESTQLSNRTYGTTGSSSGGQIVDKTNRELIYQSGDSIFAVSIDTHKTRLIHVFPEELGVTISSVNADGTLLAGKYNEGRKADEIRRQYPQKSDYFTKIYEAHVKHSLITYNMKTGETKVLIEKPEWFNHIQFSPKDPEILMFCHEGPWHKVDRIWTINVNTGDYRLMHERTMDMEIAGHEFFSPDGKTIWFDLQQPRSVTFFLCGTNVETGQQTKYEMTRNDWSIHFNTTPEEDLFCGDGGDPGQVARAEDGMWIYLFRPQGDKFVSEKLVSMKNHNYKLEPNVHFSPDKKWVIFRSNMHGETHVYAVEIEKHYASN